MTDSISCPVCGEKFENEQGKGGHVASLKDAAHVAYRTQGTLTPPSPSSPAPPAPASPAPSQEPTVQPLGEAPSPASDPAPSQPPNPAPQAQPSNPEVEPLQQESEPLAFVPVSFEPSQPVQPLAGDAQTPGPATKLPVVVPLEPILAGTVTLGVNALFLNRPVDTQVTQQQVRETGFPGAAERLVREQFPDLPLDHPVTALLISGANLAILVASCRGALAAKPEPSPEPSAPTEASAEGATQKGSSHERTAPPDSPKGTTGDPYWDAILAKAGGIAP